MPQTAQHSLVHVLLLWITILSIIQVVFVTLYFTQDKSQNCNAVDPEPAKLSTTNNKPLSDTLQLGQGKMLTFTCYSDCEGHGRVKWDSKFSTPGPLSVDKDKGELKIMEDGYYFINLQVKLETCTVTPPAKDIEVCLKLNNGSDEGPSTLLRGWIRNDTCSTGPLLKIVSLTEGTLEVTISQTFKINKDESMTHLDIIYMSP